VTATPASHRSTIHPIRRAGAVATDVVLVLIWPVLAAVTSAERFPLLDPTDGAYRFTPGDQARISEIEDGFNRVVERDGALYALDTVGWLLTTAALVVAVLVVGVLIPALTGGRTPGRFLLRFPPRVARRRSTATRPGTGGRRPTSGRPGYSAGSAPTDRSDAILLTDPEGRTAPAAGASGTGSERNTTIDLVGDRPPKPSARWLGRDDDYLRWIRDTRSRTPRRRMGPTGLEPFDELVLPESSLSESPLTAMSRSEAADGSPVWSERHGAWLFRDRRTDLWYRHETGRDRWVVLEADGAT
jgi:hypothetical protein